MPQLLHLLAIAERPPEPAGIPHVKAINDNLRFGCA